MTGSPPSEAAPAAESASAQSAPAGTESQGAVETPTTPVGDAGDKSPSSILDAVMRGINADKAATEGSPNSENPGSDVPDAEDQPLPDEVTADELNRYHSRTRRRIQQLLDKNKATSTEVGQLKPLAEQAQRINQFVQASGLTFEEVNSGFELMALMKSDPFSAREKLQPIWDTLNKLCGHELPPELQQKVDQGYVDEATARELAQNKARAHIATNANKRTADTIQQARQQAALQQFMGNASSAIKTFEENWKRSDPDHSVKLPLVKREFELSLSRLAQQGKAPKTPAEVVQVIEDAKKAVEGELKRILPRREAISPLPTGGVTTNGNPKPRSMAEAIAQGLRA